ncbi:MAG TPA: DUF2207 domain-containing protein, partial [Spirochaetes bacterium]|nr:DUF2207 domain-containing protein [Spirochaetota bacterium]
MSIFRKFFLSIPLFLSVLSLALPAYGLAGEKILSFHSDIQVNADGTMTVRETIQVIAEGNHIKRGISRDFPTVYHQKYGLVKKTGFRVLEVLRDGKKESYHLESQSNGERVYIGDKNHFLSNGVYTYQISYYTDRQLGFFEEFDELYWNVTGNGWAFPIDRATASVYLPVEARNHIYATDGYTGPEGSKEKDYRASKDHRNIIHFAATRPLAASEGLTVAVRWAKGHIAEPGPAERRARFFRDNISLVLGSGGLVLVFIYYFIAWFIAGRDPRRGTIIPHYTPPDNLSPASMRYITRMGFDHETFAAALVNMAVQGHLSINEMDGEYSLSKLGPPGKTLSPEGQKISEKLFGSKQSITIEQSQ